VSTTDTHPARPDRRPDWLQPSARRTRPAEADIREHFEQLVLQAVDVGRPMRLTDSGVPLFDTEDEARDEGRLLYSTARRLGLSVASRITDPATGRCELCGGGWSSGQQCQPSPRGGYDLHYSAFGKKDSYAYMLQRYGADRSTWPYDPMAGKNGTGRSQPGQADEQRQPAFGVTSRTAAEPDPEPAKRSMFDRPPKTPAETKTTAKTTAQDEGESLGAKLRRFVG
jgi:hypothetical protein